MNPDLSILYLFNRTLAAEWLDPIMIVLTNVQMWFPVYLIAAVLVVYYKKWAGVRLVLSTIVFIGLLNLFTNTVIKPAVARERPCASLSNNAHTVGWIRLPDGMRWGYSFPSSHAVNNFGGVVFFIALFPRKRWLLWLLLPAAIVSLTRLYLGLHYPSDTLGGAALGAICGYGWAYVHRAFEKRLPIKNMGTQRTSRSF